MDIINVNSATSARTTISNNGNNQLQSKENANSIFGSIPRIDLYNPNPETNTDIINTDSTAVSNYYETEYLDKSSDSIVSVYRGENVGKNTFRVIDENGKKYDATYDDNGLLKSIRYFSKIDGGRPVYTGETQTLTYNGGKTIVTTQKPGERGTKQYFSNGICYQEDTLNGSGKPIKREKFDASGNTVQTTEYEYNANGQIVLEKTTDNINPNKNTIAKYDYRAPGSSEYYDKSIYTVDPETGEEILTHTESYGRVKNGSSYFIDITDSKEYDENGKVISKAEYIYDQRGEFIGVKRIPVEKE